MHITFTIFFKNTTEVLRYSVIPINNVSAEQVQNSGCRAVMGA